jgi:hypothetical protein
MKIFSRICLILLFSFLLLPWHLLLAQGVPHFNALSWGLSPDAGVTSQKVYRGTVKGGPYTVLTTLGPTITTFQDNSVIAGVTHCYVLTALIGTAESVFSGELCTIDKGTNVNPQGSLAVTSQ